MKRMYLTSPAHKVYWRRCIAKIRIIRVKSSYFVNDEFD